MAIMACVVMIFATACGKNNTPFTHGTWDGRTYTSEFLGLKIQFGTEWVPINDANLAKTVGISDMSEKSIQKVFDKGGSIYELMSAKSNGSSINITVQDNDKASSLSEKVFFDAGVPLIKKQYESTGYKCSVEKSVVSFLGKNTDCIDLSLTQGEKTLYCILIPVFKSHYTACIVFGSLSKPDLYSLLAMASAI